MWLKALTKDATLLLLFRGNDVKAFDTTAIVDKSVTKTATYGIP